MVACEEHRLWGRMGLLVVVQVRDEGRGCQERKSGKDLGCWGCRAGALSWHRERPQHLSRSLAVSKLALLPLLSSVFQGSRICPTLYPTRPVAPTEIGKVTAGLKALCKN